MIRPTQIFKIMIVDDRPENLFSLRSILEDEKTCIIEASSGKHALTLTQLHDFALIFSDVQMESMDGFEFLRELRSNPSTSAIPVIFVTAINKDIKYIHRGYAGGAVDYMFKPLDNTIVKAKAEAFCELFLLNKLLSERQTELIRVNADLKEINLELERFSYVAAHDLKSPLANIVALCNGLLASYERQLDAEGNELIGYIRQSALDLCDLINGILQYHRNDLMLNLDFKDVHIQEMCRSLGIMLSYESDKIEFQLPKLPIVIRINESAMQQILLNLFSNSLKFNDKSKTVIKIEFSENNDFYHFIVSDNGPGVELKFHDQIFELFSTLDRPDRNGNYGSGIGLSTVKKLILKMGGNYRVLPRKNTGFTFEFTLLKRPKLIETTTQLMKLSKTGSSFPNNSMDVFN